MSRAARRRRLSRSSEFDRVYRHGRSQANRFLILYAFPREHVGVSARGRPDSGSDAPDDSDALAAAAAVPSPAAGSTPADRDAPAPEPRLGLSVSRRVGGAVDRARVKRTLREAFRTHAARLAEDADYVIVARPPSRELAEREGTAGMERELAELIARLPGSRHAAAVSPSEVDGTSSIAVESASTVVGSASTGAEHPAVDGGHGPR